jgi:hypothetical protein
MMVIAITTAAIIHLGNVRLGSEADIPKEVEHVCFGPKTDLWHCGTSQPWRRYQLQS